MASIVSSVKPLKFEGNRNEKINTLLIIKRWNTGSLMEAISKSEIQDKPALLGVVRIAVQLCEFDFHLVERAVERVGVEKCMSVLKDVIGLVETESVDSLEQSKDLFFTVEGRRRTPGGIYWKIFKAQVSSEDAKFVFKDNTKRQQGIRRDLVRDRWTENHLSLKRPRGTPEVDAVKRIAKALSMSEVSIIERLVVKKSVEYALGILRETETIVANTASTSDLNAVVLDDNQVKRRRTPGGVFAHLVKTRIDISESDLRFIFARATGGRAPSMSDLMSMSLAMVDRPRTVSLLAAKPVQPPDWEYQKKVGNVWEPGFIGADNFTDNLPEIDPTDSPETVLGKAALGLKIYNETDFLDRLVSLIPPEVIREVYAETVAVERAGGLPMGGSNARRRTPKGVFISLLRKRVDAKLVQTLITRVSATADMEDSLPTVSSMADRIVIELERMRVPESDYEIVRNVVALRGESYTRTLFEKVRKRFNKGKWMDTPGQLFGRMLKSPLAGGLSNDELNTVFESTRAKQMLRTNRRPAPQVIVPSSRKAQTLSALEEKCVREITLGLALIGVTASDVSTIERVVQRLGDERASQLLARTSTIEAEGGLRTRDQQRRKTPSGVYLSLLTTEGKVGKEDLKMIFEKKRRIPEGAGSSEERKKEDSHFAPSLFTPINPFRVIDNSGRDPAFTEEIKKQVRPVLSSLEFISVLDPRLETVIRGVVLLGPSLINLIDKCVHTFGEKRTEGWLEISHAQVADAKAPVESLPAIYNDLVKAAGGLHESTTGTIRC